MDANYLWSYAPNIFDYQNSVITCDANGHTVQETEENDTQGQGGFTVPLTFEL